MMVDEVFLDRVAHDLRGELSTMLTGVHYLLRFGRDVPTTTRDMLERIGGAGDRLTRLLEEFDDTVWLLDKPKPLLTAPVRLKALLNDVVGRSGKPAVLRGGQVRAELGDGDDGEFVGDAEMLARALMYIVDLFMIRAPEQVVRVVGTFEQGVPVVRVLDEGASVPDALLERLFEPFVENDLVPISPQGRRKLRLGLGLAISRSIFEAHGGSVDVESSSATGVSGLVLRCVLTR